MAWEPATAAAKNDKGEYVALIGGQWVPVMAAAKNDKGEFLVDRGGAAQSHEPANQEPSLGRYGRVALNAVNEGIVAIPDTLLNAPTNALNLARAAIGMGAHAVGLPDRAPNLHEAPNFVSRGMRAIGATQAENEPQTAGERFVAGVVSGLPGALVNPARSVQGAIQGAASGAISGGAGAGTAEVAGPTAGQFAAVIAPSAVGAVSGMGSKGTALAAQLQRQNEVRDATLNRGREMGYVVPPSEVEGTRFRDWTSERLESIGGKAALKQQATLRNQRVTNAEANADIGIPRDTALTVDRLNDYRNAVSQPYREVAALPTLPPVQINSTRGGVPRWQQQQSPADALHDLQQARFDASAHWREYRRTGEVAARDRARAADSHAQALETHLENTANAAGRPDLVQAMREARQLIAKSHDIQEGLNLGNAGVSAPTLGRNLDSGARLSGNLLDIAKFQQAFPQVMGEGARTPPPGVSKSEALAGALLAGQGSAAHGGAGLLAGGIPLVSKPVRAFVLSPMWQEFVLRRDYSPGAVSRLMASLPPDTPKDAVMRAIVMQAGQQIGDGR